MNTPMISSRARSRSKAIVVAAVGALALAACATATPYGPSGPGARYGYSDQQLESDRYRVTFSGNSVTSREQVEMSLLLRAAELTVQNGRDWFATVNRATERDTRYYADPDPFYMNRYGGFWSPHWRFHMRGAWSPWDPYWGRHHSRFDVRQVDRYEASSEVVMGRGAKPAGDPNAFDAREVIDNLGPRVNRPQG